MWPSRLCAVHVHGRGWQDSQRVCRGLGLHLGAVRGQETEAVLL